MQLTHPRIRERAKAMRHEPTLSEARVWSWLRNRRFGRFKFRRQHPIGDFIVDFYCDELKLAIELDGAQHECIAVCEVDDARTLVLHGYGIEIVRISNRLLARDPVTAAESIQWAIDRAVARTR
jgi:type I restriction enzyme, R subunit